MVLLEPAEVEEPVDSVDLPVEIIHKAEPAELAEKVELAETLSMEPAEPAE
jgi:hypothetical protein